MVNERSLLLRSCFAVAVVLGLSIGRVPVARATTEILQGLSDLTRGSHHVAFGRVAGVETRRESARGRVRTHVHFVVLEMIKGAPTDSLDLVQDDIGSWDGVLLGIEGTPRFTPGEELVVFTHLHRRGFEIVNGIQQGWYPVRRDSVTRERYVEGLPADVAVPLVRRIEPVRGTVLRREGLPQAFGRIRAAAESPVDLGRRETP